MTESNPAHDYDLSWADYVLYMEAGAEILDLDVSELTNEPEGRTVPQDWVVWGLGVSCGIAALATFLAKAPVWPLTLPSGRHPFDAVLIAIVIGIALGNIAPPAFSLRPGLKYAVKRVLPFGIMLLGARLNLRDLVAVGAPGLLLSLGVVAISIVGMLLIAKPLGLSGKLATLLGVGTAICGGSAIVATAPVIEADEEDIAFSVSTVALLGLLGMFVLPAVGGLLDMSQQAFGIWAGLTIHQTPQVVAAGFAFGPEAGEAATVVKLVRICLLAPAVFIIGTIYARQRKDGGEDPSGFRYRDLVPSFIFGLLILVVIRTLGLLPSATFALPPDSVLGGRDLSIDLVTAASVISKACIVVAMAAVGMETSLKALRKTGLRPFVAAAAISTVVTAVTYGAVLFGPGAE